MSADVAFGKEQVDSYLKKVAKQYRKLTGKTCAGEIALNPWQTLILRED